MNYLESFFWLRYALPADCQPKTPEEAEKRRQILAELDEAHKLSSRGPVRVEIDGSEEPLVRDRLRELVTNCGAIVLHPPTGADNDGEKSKSSRHFREVIFSQGIGPVAYFKRRQIVAGSDVVLKNMSGNVVRLKSISERDMIRQRARKRGYMFSLVIFLALIAIVVPQEVGGGAIAGANASRSAAARPNDHSSRKVNSRNDENDVASLTVWSPSVSDPFTQFVKSFDTPD